MKKDKVVAVIPARKGSKRLPHKNRLDFCGKPLACWSIEQALTCEFIDEVILNTDDKELMELCYRYLHEGRFRIYERPPELAQDTTPLEHVIKDCLINYNLNTIVILLQPTSPLRTVFNISHAYDIFKERVSCTLVPVFREDEYHFKLNGSIFIFSLATVYFSQILRGEFMCIYIMPKDQSVDIDTLEDFKEAEQLMEERLRNG